MSKYPEHDKLASIQEMSQSIGEFLCWLQGEHGVILAKYHTHSAACFDELRRTCDTSNGPLVPTYESIPGLLSKYFGIDEERLEDERLQIIEDLRSMQSTG